MSEVSTVLLGQFTDEHAEQLVERLEAAGIVHWIKRSGGLARLLFAGDWGTRIFVEQTRAEDAAELAREVLGDGA